MKLDLGDKIDLWEDLGDSLWASLWFDLEATNADDLLTYIGDGLGTSLRAILVDSLWADLAGTSRSNE